jgi:hypothetical protein
MCVAGLHVRICMGVHLHVAVCIQMGVCVCLCVCARAITQHIRPFALPVLLRPLIGGCVMRCWQACLLWSR